MTKCACCGAELPDGATECPNCLVCQEPPAKYAPCQLVKITIKEHGYTYYNYVVDSYYNREVNKHMYRLNEHVAMPVWPEDWLGPVSDEEIERINSTGLLRPGKMGGYEHPIEEAQV